jgi:HPt (histidine-containing phosphotransfer) domain-containing protein
MPDNKLYDLGKLNEMLGDDAEEVRNLLNIFVSITPVSLQSMNEGYEEDDAKKIATYAHKMKASLAILDIDALFDIVRKIDKQDKVEDIRQEELDKIISTMNQVINEVIDQLREEYQL